MIRSSLDGRRRDAYLRIAFRRCPGTYVKVKVDRVGTEGPKGLREGHSKLSFRRRHWQAPRSRYLFVEDWAATRADETRVLASSHDCSILRPTYEIAAPRKRNFFPKRYLQRISGSDVSRTKESQTYFIFPWIQSERNEHFVSKLTSEKKGEGSYRRKGSIKTLCCEI